jgi:RNA polymerase sigma-70 factor (ECF subfamily)
MNAFLASVERRAFRMAEFAVRNRDDALDIVQDVMLTLVRKYADKPEAEWAPLFFRILSTRITDFHRRQTVRRRLFVFASAARDDEDPDAQDPFAHVANVDSAEPEFRARLDGASSRMVELVEALPLRQQQAFLLRVWEGFDVAETAAAMGCSEGSVKTHLSRAVHALRAQLGEHWGG